MRHFRKTLLYPRPDRPANENTTAAPQPDPPQHVEIPCAGGQGGRHKKYPPSSSDHGRPRFDFDDQNHQEDDPLQGRESPQGDRQEVPRLQGQRERLHRRRRGEEGESHFIHIRMPTRPASLGPVALTPPIAPPAGESPFPAREGRNPRRREGPRKGKGTDTTTHTRTRQSVRRRGGVCRLRHPFDGLSQEDDER